jgi:hypothetical protein
MRSLQSVQWLQLGRLVSARGNGGGGVRLTETEESFEDGLESALLAVYGAGLELLQSSLRLGPAVCQ